MVPILRVRTLWVCPNCDTKDVTEEARPHVRLHTCPALFGVTAPMVPAGTKCKVEAVEREDYIGNEKVQTDSRGRPIMAIITTRDDGEDRVVLAPSAHIRAG